LSSTIWHTYMKLVTKYQIPVINSCWEKCDEKCAYMFNVYKNQQSRQTGSRNLMGPKTLPRKRCAGTIWSNLLKSLLLHIYVHHLHCRFLLYSRSPKGEGGILFYVCPSVLLSIQDIFRRSRNLMGPKTLPTIWGTYMKLVTKYQIPAINSYWEKCDEKYLADYDCPFGIFWPLCCLFFFDIKIMIAPLVSWQTLLLDSRIKQKIALIV
jgi:hypothetical protein